MYNFDITSENERFHIALLLDCYGNMLTEKQRSAVELYFQDDLSLSEISALHHITRQAVQDRIRQGVQTLQQLDEKLNFLKRIAEYEAKIAKLEQEIQ